MQQTVHGNQHQQANQKQQQLGEAVDATLPASGSGERSGRSSPVHGTGSAGLSSMERAGHVPPTPQGQMGRLRAGARCAPHMNPTTEGEGLGG